MADLWITFGDVRFPVAGFAIGWLNLGTLGLLIGWNGGSRAYGTGLHTLFLDHAAAVIVAWLVAVVVAGYVRPLASSVRDIGFVLLWVVVADVVAALAVAAGIGEITIVNLPQVLFVETVAGSQLVAVVIGLLGGTVLRRRTPSPRW